MEFSAAPGVVGGPTVTSTGAPQLGGPLVATAPRVEVPTASEVPSSGVTPGGRVHGIDGLRAVAALWVVGFHMFSFSGGSVAPGIDFILRSGSTGVSLFLVLSGLCLYLPYAGGRQGRFSSRDFFRRRMRRLLPAYYVSLALVLIAHVVTKGNFGLPAYSPQEYAVQTVTHATLTHQLFPETFYGLNGAYWSLGLEWELYLTLPLLILAAVRFGLSRVIISVFAATAVWRLGIFAAMQTGALDPAGPWANVVLPNFFLGRWSEFALGMLAAEMFRTRRLRVRPPLVLGAFLAGALALAFPDNPLNHMLYGVVFFTLVLTVLSEDNVVARAFAWRPLVAIGVMSYSLYLVHQPIVEAFGYVLGERPGADPRTVFLAMVALFPVVLLVALGLFAGVERRSVTPAGTTATVRELLFPSRGVAPTPAGASPGEAKPGDAGTGHAAEPALSRTTAPGVERDE